MPTLLGTAILAIGGMVAWRMLRREWTRVNADLEAQRSQVKTSQDAQRLEKDPQTGVYRPADD